MIIEYRTPPEDNARLEQMLWSRHRWRQALLFVLPVGGMSCTAGGGVLIGLAGARWGYGVAIIGTVGVIIMAIAWFRVGPSLAKARQQWENEPWRDRTYRVRLDETGMTWEVPGAASHLRWDGVAEAIDRAGWFILIERPSAAPLGFGIPHVAFPDEAALREARELLRRHVPGGKA